MGSTAHAILENERGGRIFDRAGTRSFRDSVIANSDVWCQTSLMEGYTLILLLLPATGLISVQFTRVDDDILYTKINA